MIETQRPIFIIGCPRSGTTLLRLILDSHPNISCGPETQFLEDLQTIVGRHWIRIERYGFEKNYWYQKIGDFFDSFQMEYAAKRGKKRWAEKSPNYTMKLGFINALFPKSQFIHIIRDGRDVVASHRDRWGYKAGIRSIRTWRNHVKSAVKFGKKSPKNCYYELRYEELVKNTEKTLLPLFEFLQEPWDANVLKYNEIEHNNGPEYETLAEYRRQSNNDNSLIYTSQVGAGQKSLDPFLRVLFNLRCGELMEELGYQ
ncbi:sulfotransferase family protein [Dapis sp. BLCC M126]|uniref:sulfotransferase family protein n=1 Tax=Dapis sp. BLCC M126 TaxID=3400189 RepID=UPI003CE90F3B